MTQAAVAGLLGRSEQWLSNIERGVRPADRYSVLLPIAEVLRVPVTELVGERMSPQRGARVERPRAARLVRLALSSHQLVGDGEAPETGVLRAQVDDVWRLVHAGRYAELGELVPGLVADCERAAWRGGGRARVAESCRLLAVLYQAVAAMMAKLGEADAAWVAPDRSAFAARRAGDALLVAAAGFRLGRALLSGGRVEQAGRAAEGAAEAVRLASLDDDDAWALWGALHLVVAIAAARGGDGPQARAALDHPEAASGRVGPDHVDRFGTEFGPENVALHRVSVAVELGESTEALRRAKTIDVSARSPERRARLLIDVARAYAQRRDGAAVVAMLEDADRLAPELVRRHPLAREAVRAVLRRERSRSAVASRPLARHMGLV